jgi:ribose 5-phosphate isomerase A
MYSQQELKQQAANAALEIVAHMTGPPVILGIGTGATVDLFIEGLARFKQHIKGAVASSERSALHLAKHGITVLDLNTITQLPLYIDSADEIDARLNMIKGGGAAHTREKIVASVAECFVCIVDESKFVTNLGTFPLPVEVLPIAQAAVARTLTALGGHARHRQGVTTDNGNLILDVTGLDMTDAPALETYINNLPGVVTCGLFTRPGADVALLATQQGIQRLTRSSQSEHIGYPDGKSQ